VRKKKYAKRLSTFKKRKLLKLKQEGKTIGQMIIQARVTHGQVLRFFYKTMRA
jgi:hypothetical protein